MTPCEPVDLGGGVRAIICGRGASRVAKANREEAKRQAELDAWSHIFQQPKENLS